MLKLVPVTEERLPLVYEKQVSAFPYEERRDFCDLKECFNNKYFNFLEIFDCEKDIFCGFVSPWNFSDFVYIEHLAVDENLRNGAYGSRTVELIKSTYNKPVILESEHGFTDIQKRRLGFYERLGFKINDYDYIQPSYHGGEGVPLKILSYPALLSKTKFEEFVKITKENVYFK